MDDPTRPPLDSGKGMANKIDNESTTENIREILLPRAEAGADPAAGQRGAAGRQTVGRDGRHARAGGPGSLNDNPYLRECGVEAKNI